MELLKTLCVRNYSYFNRSIMMSYNTVLGTRFVGTHLNFNLFAPPYPLIAGGWVVGMFPTHIQVQIFDKLIFS